MKTSWLAATRKSWTSLSSSSTTRSMTRQSLSFSTSSLKLKKWNASSRSMSLKTKPIETSSAPCWVLPLIWASCWKAREVTSLLKHSWRTTWSQSTLSQSFRSKRWKMIYNPKSREKLFSWVGSPQTHQLYNQRQVCSPNFLRCKSERGMPGDWESCWPEGFNLFVRMEGNHWSDERSDDMIPRTSRNTKTVESDHMIWGEHLNVKTIFSHEVPVQQLKIIFSCFTCSWDIT